MGDTIRIQMMNTFTIYINEIQADHMVNKSRKGVALMQYLILNREQPVPNQRLLAALWSEEKSANPENALKTLVSRLRALRDLAQQRHRLRGAGGDEQLFNANLQVAQRARQLQQRALARGRHLRLQRRPLPILPRRRAQRHGQRQRQRRKGPPVLHARLPPRVTPQSCAVRCSGAPRASRSTSWSTWLDCNSRCIRPSGPSRSSRRARRAAIRCPAPG